MSSLTNSSLKAMGGQAGLSTTAARLDQAYRIEKDTFGELKVEILRGLIRSSLNPT